MTSRAPVCSQFVGCLAFAVLWITEGAAAAPSSITVGRLTLTICNTTYNGYCGAIDQRLDPSGSVPGTVTVGFEFYPRTDDSRPGLGTIVPQEGGPGYSSTGSRDYYLSLFGPLRDRRDVVIIDKRGTGLSDPINCPAMQTGSLALSAAAACSHQLGPTTWFYGTAFAAEDIVAVLDALEINEVDFYGDSYGTFFGQVLAGLYPRRLRSIILDSAYPVRAPDPWFATDWATAWSGIDRSCTRSPSCSSLGGSATGRMRNLLAGIRRQPITGTAPDANGALQSVTLDTGALLRLIDAAGNGASIYRDLDSGARAWLDAADPLPILRLVAEQSTSVAYDPSAFSYGLYAAVTCSDYPLLYDLTAAEPDRKREYQEALGDARQHRPSLFAPFTIDEGLQSQVYITPLDSCLPWRAPPPSLHPGRPLPPGARFPGVPTLVLSGDLDSVTSPEDAAATAAQFPNATHIVVPNLTHVVAGSDLIACTSSIVHRFVKSLAPGDTACIANVRPVRTVPVFTRVSSGLAPVEALAGNAATVAQRRIAAAGLEAVGDVLARYWASVGTTGRGLRGGQFSYSGTATGYDFVLDGVRWTEDVAVSGVVSWNTVNNGVTANVTLSQAGSHVGTLRVNWNDADINAIAALEGKILGRTLEARRIAP
jgi:pimeloyl-ACP methyl ester carboxylesterase